MRHTALRFLLLLLTLLLLSGSALALEIDEIVTNEDGTITLTWTDPANAAPYTLGYELYDSAPLPFACAINDIADTSYTCQWLAPGVSYMLYVTNAQGDMSSVYAYMAPEVVEENKLGTRIRVNTRVRTDTGIREQAYSAADIAEHLYETEYLVAMEITYSQLARARKLRYTVCAVAPNGYAEVLTDGLITLPAGESTLPTQFLSLDSFFDTLQSFYYGIPAGEYTLALYYDGKLVQQTPFTVQE